MPGLPEFFAVLEPFVDEWVLSDSQARADKRLYSDIDALRTFYDTARAQAPAILEYLEQRLLGTLTADDERLLKLMLSLAEVGPAIE